MRTQLPQLWLDLDGCFANFHAGALTLGVDIHDPVHDRRSLWKRINASPGFWSGLPLMEDVDLLWEAVRHHNPIFLTGVASNVTECSQAKRGWVARHFGEAIPCVVVRSQEKDFYARPGDILIDDLEANILRWERAGGIGILHQAAESTIRRLRELGVHPDGRLGENLLAEVSRRRSEKKFRRKGYTGYRLTEASQRMLASAFPPRWFSPNSRISCHHITRSFPAGDDITTEPRPHIRVVGEFHDEALGCHALVAEVDGQVLRDNGELFHVTLSYDRELGAKRSGVMLRELVREAGGLIDILYNLPEERCLPVKAEFKLFRPWDHKLARPAVVRFPETTSTEEYIFPSGEKGGVTYRRSADEVTIIHQDDQGRLHNEGAAAVRRIKLSTGKTLYARHHRHGQEIDPSENPVPDAATRFPSP